MHASGRRIATFLVVTTVALGTTVVAAPPAVGDGTADVSLTVAAPPSATLNEVFQFSVKVVNHGPDEATGVEFSTSTPGGTLPYQAWSSTDPTDTCSSPPVTSMSCTLGSMVAGEEAIVTITAERVSTSAFTDDASVSSSSTDPFSANDSDFFSMDEVVIPPDPSTFADLAVSMSAPASPAVGSTFDLSMTVTNHGPAAATNVTVTNNLPAELSFVSVAPLGCSYSSGYRRVSCFRPTLAGGDSFAITLSATRVDGAPFTDTVGVTGTEYDPDGGNNSASASFDPDPDAAADLALSMAGPSTPATGSAFDLTITVTNGGPVTATDVTVIDDLPSQVSFLSVVPAGCGYASGTRQVSCSTSSLASGASLVITLSLRRESGAPFTNTATAASATYDDNLANNATTRSFSLDPAAAADVGIALAADPPSPAVGATFDYVVTLTNHGPASSTGSRFSLFTPDGVAISDAPAGCEIHPGDGYVTCDVGPMASGASRQMPVTVTRDIGYALGAADASLASDPLDPNDDNDSVSLSIAGDPSWAADMSVTLAGPPQTPAVGSSFTVNATVGNNGPHDAEDVVVEISKASGTTWVDVQPGSCSPLSGSTYRCDLGSIGSGTQAVISATLSRETPEGGWIDARVSSRFDLDPSDDSASFWMAPDPNVSADIGVIVEGPETTPTKGSTFPFTITVTNHGPNLGHDVILEDDLPNAVSFVSASPASCAYDPAERSVACDLGDIATNGSRTVTVNVKRETATSFTNEARVSSLLDPNTENDSDEAFIDVDPAAGADMAAAITGPASTPAVGANFTYVVTLTNTGPGTATNVRLTAPVPTQARFVSVTPGSCWYRNTNRNVRCNVASLANGQAMQASITLRRLSGSAFSVTGSVASDLDLNPSNDAASAAIPSTTPPVTLTVSLAGTGTGTVTSNPAGISCGTTCSAGFTVNTVVTLTATPGGSSSFAGWSGSGCSGTGTCQLTMNTAKSVTATFVPSGPVNLFPTSTTITSGTLAGGTVANLAAQDAVFYSVASTTAAGTKTATWYGSFTGVSSGVQSMQVTYAGKNSVQASQTIAIWRWTDSTWVVLNTRTVGATVVRIANLVPPGTLADYVSSTGGVAVRVRATTSAVAFTNSGDLMQLTVTQ